MADLYEPKTCAASSSSSDAPCGFPQDRDDVSVFLQNLFQSSSTSSVSPSTPASFMSFMARHVPSFYSFPPPSAALMESGSAGGAVAPFGRGGAGSPLRRNLTDSAECFPVAGKERMRYSLSFGGCSGPPMITSSAKQTKSLTDTDLNGAGCDIEGPPEEIDVHLKPAPLRSSSKRSRAAEVHNLSEKRRRSRINEKMKALQMLIPNSNKTDKASMLDEAIEYLKQLQLQVQMLSMRNGLNLQSVYVPGGVQPMPLAQPGVAFEEGNGLSGGSQTAPVHSSAFHIPEHSFGLQQTVATHYGCYAPSMSSKDVCRGDTLPLLQLDMGIAGKQSSEDAAS